MTGIGPVELRSGESSAPGPPAILVLEDGTSFRGRGLGVAGETFGEAVFNTAMAGYQEVLTDPSYAGQIVTMTAPHVGNYGLNRGDAESDRMRVAGFVVREASRRSSSWRAEETIHEALGAAGVVGIEGIDTRRLTLRIREAGAMRAGISTADLDARSLLERVRAHPAMRGADLASAVSTPVPYAGSDIAGEPAAFDGPVYRIAAYDFGIKRTILRQLAANGCETTVFPARTPAGEVLAGNFDGVFLSNGPGDPAATTYGVRAAAELLGKVPVFGICLGHQLMALALAGESYKLRFGHRGVNQPVQDLETRRVEITSHNHGFAIDAGGWIPAASTRRGGFSTLPSAREHDERRQRRRPFEEAPSAETPFGEVLLNRWNLNDRTLEGLRCLDVPALSVQYHPEAGPGPHDSRELFASFRELMA
jgi:carbamoyl-phosphate synthase small subunit